MLLSRQCLLGRVDYLGERGVSNRRGLRGLSEALLLDYYAVESLWSWRYAAALAIGKGRTCRKDINNELRLIGQEDNPHTVQSVWLVSYIHWAHQSPGIASISFADVELILVAGRPDRNPCTSKVPLLIDTKVNCLSSRANRFLACLLSHHSQWPICTCCNLQTCIIVFLSLIISACLTLTHKMLRHFKLILSRNTTRVTYSVYINCARPSLQDLKSPTALTVGPGHQGYGHLYNGIACLSTVFL